ncbi:MAG: hypothetical protein RLZZ252_63 [Bacteroidota bacterium]
MLKHPFNLNLKSLIFTCILVGLAVFQTGCEDEIKVSVDYNKPKLVVDAFINNLPETQTITLSKGVNYFDTNAAPAVTNAQVLLFDTTAGKPYFFQHTEKGKYQFTPNPATGDTFTIGHDYALFILVDGDTLASFCNLARTATIDSIRLVDVEGNGPPFNTTGYYVELMAKDAFGKGDFYWIKTFRNDTFLNDIDQLNISADMGNTSTEVDGELFIYPIRYSGVNDFLRSFKKDETVRLEIHSISAIAYGWFNLVRNENQNGGLFATPPANIFSNIIAINKNPKNTLGGLFCMSSVVRETILIPE